MNNQITQYQNRLFYKLFATLPSIKKVKDFNMGSNFDFEVNSFYHIRNKDFWFAKSENEDKYLFLFGILDKPLINICGNDTCLIIDFDKNIQFNSDCLGLFSIKNFHINILINFKLLKEKYPYIDTNFEISNFKSHDNSLDLEVINLGSLDDDFIDNLEKLIKECNIAKSKEGDEITSSKESTSQKIKRSHDNCEICSKDKSAYKIDSNLNNLKKVKPDLCGVCLEKIVVSEFCTKLTPLLKGNMVKDLNIAKEKFGNDHVFEIGLKLLEKYKIIQYIGVKKLFFTIDADSYLIRKYIKYSDKNNLLIDNIVKNNDSKSKNKSAIEETTVGVDSQDNDLKEQIDADNQSKSPKLIKTDSFGNKNSINQMNIILEDLSSGKSEDEAISHANVSKSTYAYWINRGKQDFGEIYVQFYNYVNEFKSLSSSEKLKKENILVNKGFYEPILEEYKFSLDSMNKSGIAWVSKNGIKWYYSRNINGKTIKLGAHTLPELYGKVKDQNLIWGISDYDKAKEFIDFPDDFEIPVMEIEEVSTSIDSGIYAPLGEEYESSFSSMNKSGIAWVNKIGNKFYYAKSVSGRSIRISADNVYELYNKVEHANQIWGIRDYGRAGKFIDFPDDFKIPTKQENEEKNDVVSNNKINESIYAPLSRDQLSKFNPNPNNKSGIAWVSKVGKNWSYKRQRNGKIIQITDPSIIKLHEKVISNNQVWGILDLEKARKVIESESIVEQDFEYINKTKSSIGKVSVTYIETSRNKFEILIKGIVKNKDLIDILIRFDLFKENIKRIITNSHNNESDIFIELELNKYSLPSFEEKIEEFGWKINK